MNRRQAMYVRVSSKGQVTFPARVLDALGVKPVDQIELVEGPEGYTLRPRRIDLSLLGGLRDNIPPGHPPFDIRKFRDLREQGLGPSLRD